MFRDQIEPHWLADNIRFWYRNDLAGGAKEFVLVDAAKGSRELAFDHAEIAKAIGEQTSATHLPIESLEYDAAGKLAALIGSGKRYAWNAENRTLTATDAPAPVESPRDRGRRRRGDDENRNLTNAASPDGKWKASIKNFNLVLRATNAEESRPLSTDGREGLAYGPFFWTPDSQSIVAFRVKEVERKLVHLIRTSPKDGGRAQLNSRPYMLPGDPFPTYEVNIFHVGSREQLKPQVDAFEHEWLRPRVRFWRDGERFSYEQSDRGHQRFRLIEIELKTGAVRSVIDERTETFIWTAHTENLELLPVNWLTNTDEIIYATEKNGWRQLILIDARSGQEVRELTPRGIVVRGIERIDDERRTVWFKACGRPGHDPYLVHFGRVDLDTGKLVWLTEGNGNHSIEFSPDRKHILDRYSRVDMPPIHELRRTEDGSLVCELEQADVAKLVESGWQSPEVFVAKGRDGQTDIWGVISRPRDFDPAKKYPVLEDIYAGPQDAYVPKSFSPINRWETLNSLGFVVVKVDGMGTAHRSKAFHDVCWKDLKDGGFADRILWMKAAAEKYPHIDLSRVGVFGGSAGGQNAAAAVLFHPEFYQAAVASCGCHDNRLDKASWNEQWMGYPVGPQYSASSNIDNAKKLQGRLMLIVGEMDDNVPPESTMRFADALIRADKDFDLIVVPNSGHGRGGEYGTRRMHDFFVRHLLGQTASNRNASQVVQPRDAPAASDLRGKSGEPSTAATTVDAPANATSTEKTRVPIVEVVTPPAEFFALVAERDRQSAREFYKKYLDVQGLPVVAAAEVADEALLRTREIVTHLLAGRPDVLQSMHESGMYLIIIGKDQVYTDMPEYRHAPDPSFMNERVRGTGGKPTSFGEENLLGLALDRYDDESIGVHEFCHTIDGALHRVDPTWGARLQSTYQAARGQKLYEGAYAGSNPSEYWAEICQSYFDCNRVNNYNHGPVGTREQLKAYDPAGYELARTTFRLSPDQDWRYHFPRKLPQVESPPAKLKVDSYYTKFCLARELVVLGRGTSDEALLRANHVVRKMFAYRHDILKAFIADNVRLVVLGRSERLSDLPELQSPQVRAKVDLLARYLDYSPDVNLLVVSEENLLADPNDSGVGSSQLVSVLAGAIHQLTGTRPVDSTWEDRPRHVWQQYELRVQRLDVRFDQRLRSLHERAMAAGKWQGTSAVQNPAAYSIAGVLAYFDAARQEAAPTDSRRAIETREQLAAYDAELYELVRETMAFDGRVDVRLK